MTTPTTALVAPTSAWPQALPRSVRQAFQEARDAGVALNFTGRGPVFPGLLVPIPLHATPPTVVGDVVSAVRYHLACHGLDPADQRSIVNAIRRTVFAAESSEEEADAVVTLDREPEREEAA